MVKPVPVTGSQDIVHRTQLANAVNGIIKALSNVFGPGSAAAVAGAATLHVPQGTITSEALTTAAGSDYALTLTNNQITDSSVIVASVDNGTNTTEGLAVNRITPSNGSALIRVRNTNASAALNGTIKIRFQVLSR